MKWAAGELVTALGRPRGYYNSGEKAMCKRWWRGMDKNGAPCTARGPQPS